MQQKERASNVPLYFDAMEAAVCKGLREWSGLSESNRHLNLGKVPYYHYTKAAELPSFYSMPATQPRAYLTPAGLEPNGQQAGMEWSGNLRDPRGLHYRRAALTLREPGGLILVRVNAAELFPVGIEDADEIVVMFAAAIFAEGSLSSNPRFFRLTFCHVGHPIGRGYVQHYLKEASAAQVPEKIVTRTSLQRKKAYS